jgi:hypothetical protein
MKLLYVSNGNVFSRHELGFVAVLNTLSNVDVVENYDLIIRVSKAGYIIRIICIKECC